MQLRVGRPHETVADAIGESRIYAKDLGAQTHTDGLHRYGQIRARLADSGAALPVDAQPEAAVSGPAVTPCEEPYRQLP